VGRGSSSHPRSQRLKNSDRRERPSVIEAQRGVASSARLQRAPNRLPGPDTAAARNVDAENATSRRNTDDESGFGPHLRSAITLRAKKPLGDRTFRSGASRYQIRQPWRPRSCVPGKTNRADRRTARSFDQARFGNGSSRRAASGGTSTTPACVTSVRDSLRCRWSSASNSCSRAVLCELEQRFSPSEQVVSAREVAAYQVRAESPAASSTRRSHAPP
jgi:hypothetical protein